MRLADLRLATKQARRQVSCAEVRADTVPTGPDVSNLVTQELTLVQQNLNYPNTRVTVPSQKCSDTVRVEIFLVYKFLRFFVVVLSMKINPSLNY